MQFRNVGIEIDISKVTANVIAKFSKESKINESILRIFYSNSLPEIINVILFLI